MVFGQGSTFPLVSVIILVDCRYCSPLVIQIQIQAQKEILHNNTLCTLTAYGYAPAPYVAPVAHAGPLIFFYNDEIFIIEDSGKNDDHNAILMGMLYIKFCSNHQ